METLSAFPHLTTSEFEDACTTLAARYDQHSLDQNEWQSVELIYQYEAKYLRITKPLQTCTVGRSTDKDQHTRSDEDEDDIEELEDDDDEVLPTTGGLEVLVVYDILLSPVYRVPVLYISIADPQHRYPPTMQTLYEHLIPSNFEAQAQSGGVIGGISIQDHPATNRPVFFIHPCQTAEAMEESVGRRNITAEEYLILWTGALGKCVGLNVPLALMQQNEV
ncbi:hypothetical protein CC86DRAFT_87276 [Ophiobolus disseminans]|uniref:Ubiquitin-like-conjugating enzyme ATG10 n=1 Tax=Ophiobolus disseminans TaxID=1469910 RepID=A0A6A7AHY3_9PLEO|nr:hypothetical protein CC86DRAFT_87276 [Ophiobolus disseminans]